MLRDRVRSLRDANVYEAQRYRHMIAPPVIEAGEGGIVHAQTSFMVVRIMHSGETTMFVTGRYDDRIVLDGADAPRFAEKVAVLDSEILLKQNKPAAICVSAALGRSRHIPTPSSSAKTGRRRPPGR